jgi:hypothetical protein
LLPPSAQGAFDSQTAANAALIAAAPEMYVALHEIFFMRTPGGTPKLIKGELIERIEVIAGKALGKANQKILGAVSSPAEQSKP